MSAPEFDARLAEIEARANAATPGPWHVGKHGSGATYVHTGELDESGAPLSQIISGEVGLEASNANAVLMAAAREDVPWLLSILAAARAERDAESKRLRAVVAAVRKLHQSSTTGCNMRTGPTHWACSGCGKPVTWSRPCPTNKALDAALSGLEPT